MVVDKFECSVFGLIIVSALTLFLISFLKMTLINAVLNFGVKSAKNCQAGSQDCQPDKPVFLRDFPLTGGGMGGGTVGQEVTTLFKNVL